MSTPTSSTMNLEKLQRVALKVFFTPQTASTFKTREVIPVFHRWIQTQAVDGLLIDVADYTHLPTGPAVILIAHEGQYSIDLTDGKLGLQYSQTKPLSGNPLERMTALTRTLLKAARLLENETLLGTPPRFRGDQLEYLANDRLLAPNTEETFTAFQSSFETLLATVSPDGDWTLEQDTDPKARFRVHALSSATATLDTLVARLIP